jgi:hypothetical protein
MASHDRPDLTTDDASLQKHTSRLPGHRHVRRLTEMDWHMIPDRCSGGTTMARAGLAAAHPEPGDHVKKRAGSTPSESRRRLALPRSAMDSIEQPGFRGVRAGEGPALLEDP